MACMPGGTKVLAYGIAVAVPYLRPVMNYFNVTENRFSNMDDATRLNKNCILWFLRLKMRFQFVFGSKPTTHPAPKKRLHSEPVNTSIRIIFVIKARKTKFAKVMFSQVSLCPRGGCLPHCMLGYNPSSGTRDRHLPTRGRHPQRSACWEIRATSGRYASYWNAYLFKISSR